MTMRRMMMVMIMRRMMDEEDDNGDVKDSDDNALSITQGKCHPANMQRLCTFSPAGPSILYAQDELMPNTYINKGMSRKL